MLSVVEAKGQSKNERNNHQSKDRFHSPAQFRGMEWKRNQTKFGEQEKTVNQMPNPVQHKFRTMKL
jgi:hypothetical protein